MHSFEYRSGGGNSFDTVPDFVVMGGKGGEREGHQRVLPDFGKDNSFQDIPV